MLQEATIKIRVKTDASAAQGISMRTGLGKLRHIDTNQLWVQDKVAKGLLKVTKIHTDVNIADHLTKYLNQNGISRHLNRTGQWLEEGRHYLMPEVAK